MMLKWFCVPDCFVFINLSLIWLVKLSCEWFAGVCVSCGLKVCIDGCDWFDYVQLDWIWTQLQQICPLLLFGCSFLEEWALVLVEFFLKKTDHFLPCRKRHFMDVCFYLHAVFLKNGHWHSLNFFRKLTISCQVETDILWMCFLAAGNCVPHMKMWKLKRILIV